MSCHWINLFVCISHSFFLTRIILCPSALGHVINPSMTHSDQNRNPRSSFMHLLEESLMNPMLSGKIWRRTQPLSCGEIKSLGQRPFIFWPWAANLPFSPWCVRTVSRIGASWQAELVFWKRRSHTSYFGTTTEVGVWWNSCFASFKRSVLKHARGVMDAHPRQPFSKHDLQGPLLTSLGTASVRQKHHWNPPPSSALFYGGKKWIVFLLSLFHTFKINPEGMVGGGKR